MGYLSDVRIKLLKKDYDRLVDSYEKARNTEEAKRLKLQIENATIQEEKRELEMQLWKETQMSDLFEKDKKSEWGDFIRKERTETIYGKYIPEENKYEQTEVDIVYFGWNGLKWYSNYKDVRFIMDFIEDCEYYAYGRIGEESGDIEAYEQELEPIYTYTAFEDE